MSAMPAEAEPRRPGPGAAELPMAGPEAAQLPTAGPEAAQLPTATAELAVGPSALRPATVRPRRAGLPPGPGGPRLRPAGLRPRRVGTRIHPTGVRACSDVMRAERLTAVRPVPQARPFLPGDAPQSLRLTRRGRIVLAVLAAVAASLFALAAVRGMPAAGSTAPAGAPGHSMTRIVVQPGQTLWSIAMRADPHADPRLVVQRIIAANALPGGSVHAGQHLVVPRG